MIMAPPNISPMFSKNCSEVGSILPASIVSFAEVIDTAYMESAPANAITIPIILKTKDNYASHTLR